jgi:hypothetical protein
MGACISKPEDNTQWCDTPMSNAIRALDQVELKDKTKIRLYRLCIAASDITNYYKPSQNDWITNFSDIFVHPQRQYWISQIFPAIFQITPELYAKCCVIIDRTALYIFVLPEIYGICYSASNIEEESIRIPLLSLLSVASPGRTSVLYICMYELMTLLFIIIISLTKSYVILFLNLINRFSPY